MKWRLLILALAGALAYSNSLTGPFIFDDTVSIVDNASIRDGLSSAAFSPPREMPTSGRPIVNVSLAINYALGGLDVRGYHIWNVAVHVVCALLLFACVRLTLERPAMPSGLPSLNKDQIAERGARMARRDDRGYREYLRKEQRRHPGCPAREVVLDQRGQATRWLVGRSADVAFAVALVWMLHPLNTEAVDYLTQRTESMMAACYLLTIYASARASGSRHRGLWQAAAVIACATGMGCKESMVTAPVVVVLHDAVFTSGSLRRAIRERWRFYGCLAATWLVLAFVLSGGPRMRSAGFSAGVSPWTYLLNQTLMIARYLRLSLWPDSLVLHYGWPRALTLGDVWPYAVLVTLVGLATLVALRRRTAFGFLGAWFFITLAPASSVVPVATEVGAERRMYLPLMALAVLAAIGLAWATERFARRRAIALVVLLAVAVPLAAATFIRNQEYASALTLAQTVVDRWPTPLAESMLGQELAIAGRHDEAMTHLRTAATGYPRAHYHLGGELFNAGRIDEAIPELQAFVSAEPALAEAVQARIMLGRGFMLRRQWPQAEEQFRLVLTMITQADPTRTTVVGVLADTLFQEQRFDEAASHYRAYLGARPTDGGAATNLGIALAALGKEEEALAAFRRAVQINPRDPAARRNLELALESKQKP